MMKIRAGKLTLDEYIILRQLYSEGATPEFTLSKMSYSGFMLLQAKGVIGQSRDKNNWFIRSEYRYLVQDARNALGVNRI